MTVEQTEENVRRGDFWFSQLTSSDLYVLRDAVHTYEKMVVAIGGDLGADYGSLLRRVTGMRHGINRAAAARFGEAASRVD